MTILKADHRDVKKMLTALADSDEGAVREKMAREVAESLTLHMNIEESLLYPLVARDVGKEDAEEADVEHGLAREGVAKMSELVEKPGFGAAVEMLKAGITHHVEEEENELLPELKSALSREQWLELGDKIAEAKAAAGAAVAPAARRKSTKRATKK
jgi:hemerythrin-like domain-containing protein